MNATTAKTVRELALEFPNATRVFEKLGIDYCCGGNKSLEEACAAANLSADEVVDSLELAEQAARASQKERNWQVEPLADVITHINRTHHKYTREEIARLGPLLDKVCSVHGKNHPELEHVRTNFRGLAQELTTHMMKEEMVLFPYIERVEEAVIQKEPLLPPPFGSVENPVAIMMHEHDSASEALRGMREATQVICPRVMPVSAIRLYTEPWRTLKPTFIGTFIWRTISCSRAQSRWNGDTEKNAGSENACNSNAD